MYLSQAVSLLAPLRVKSDLFLCLHPGQDGGTFRVRGGHLQGPGTNFPNRTCAFQGGMRPVPSRAEVYPCACLSVYDSSYMWFCKSINCPNWKILFCCAVLAQDIVARVNTFTAAAAVDTAAHAADSCNDCRKSAFDQFHSICGGNCCPFTITQRSSGVEDIHSFFHMFCGH